MNRYIVSVQNREGKQFEFEVLANTKEEALKKTQKWIQKVVSNE